MPYCDKKCFCVSLWKKKQLKPMSIKCHFSYVVGERKNIKCWKYEMDIPKMSDISHVTKLASFLHYSKRNKDHLTGDKFIPTPIVLSVHLFFLRFFVFTCLYFLLKRCQCSEAPVQCEYVWVGNSFLRSISETFYGLTKILCVIINQSVLLCACFLHSLCRYLHEIDKNRA